MYLLILNVLISNNADLNGVLVDETEQLLQGGLLNSLVAH